MEFNNAVVRFNALLVLLVCFCCSFALLAESRCVCDSYEPNNSPCSAAVIPSAASISNASLCPSYDEDFYVFSLDSAKQLKLVLEVNSSAASGTIGCDLSYLDNSTSSNIGVMTGLMYGNGAEVTLNLRQGDHLLRCFGVNVPSYPGATDFPQISYSVRFEYSTSSCSSDRYEPNDSSATATVIQLPFREDLTLCPSGDIDFYRFTIEFPSVLNLTRYERDSNFGFAVKLYGPENLELTFLNSMNRIYLQRGSYLVEVSSLDQSKSPNYFLEITADNYTFCLQNDTSEPNDYRERAFDLGLISSEYLLQSMYCPGNRDVDWYQFSIPDYGKLTLSFLGNIQPLSGSVQLISSAEHVLQSFQSGNLTVDVFPGSYHLRLSASAGSFSVPATAYSVSLVFEPTPATCSAAIALALNGTALLPNGESIRGSFCPVWRVKYYSFVVAQLNTRQFFDISNSGGYLSAQIRNSNNTLLGDLFFRTHAATNNASSLLIHSDSTRLLPGNYVLEIRTDGFHDGPFELLYRELPIDPSNGDQSLTADTLEKNDSPTELELAPTQNYLPVGAPYVSVLNSTATSLFPSFDSDWVSVSLNSTVQKLSANALPALCFIYASDGVTLLAEPASIMSPTSLLSVAAGRYLIRVVASPSAADHILGSYTLAISWWPYRDAASEFCGKSAPSLSDSISDLTQSNSNNPATTSSGRIIQQLSGAVTTAPDVTASPNTFNTFAPLNSATTETVPNSKTGNPNSLTPVLTLQPDIGSESNGVSVRPLIGLTVAMLVVIVTMIYSQQ